MRSSSAKDVMPPEVPFWRLRSLHLDATGQVRSASERVSPRDLLRRVEHRRICPLRKLVIHRKNPCGWERETLGRVPASKDRFYPAGFLALVPSRFAPHLLRLGLCGNLRCLRRVLAYPARRATRSGCYSGRSAASARAADCTPGLVWSQTWFNPLYPNHWIRILQKIHPSRFPLLTPCRRKAHLRNSRTGCSDLC